MFFNISHRTILSLPDHMAREAQALSGLLLTSEGRRVPDHMRRPLLPLGYQSIARQSISLSVKVHVLYVYDEKIVRGLRRSLLWVIWDCTGVVRRPGKYVKKRMIIHWTIIYMPLLSHYLEESSCWKHPLSSQTGTRWLFNKFNLDKARMSSVSSGRKCRFYTEWASPRFLGH